MIYDGFDFEPYLTVESVHRAILPPVSTTSSSGAGDGSALRDVRLGELQIDVDVRLNRPADDCSGLDSAFADVRRAVSRRLFKREPCPLVLYDEPDVEYMAVLTGTTDLDSFVWTKTATLTFLCPSPVALGKENMRSSDGGSLGVAVGGTYPALPAIRVLADGPFAVDIDGEEFTVLGNASGYTVIDSSDRTVTCDGKYVQHSIYSDFPELEPGPHTVSCPLPFDVWWRDAWL